MGDELVDPLLEFEAEQEPEEFKNWPPELYVYLKFGYENTMKAQLDSDGTTFATWIDEVMTHVQSYYRHPTLPTKIQFKVSK